MSQILVTAEDVAGAIAAFRAQGIADPGVHRIRAALGRGSVSTIARLKHALGPPAGDGEAAPDGLPDPIRQAAGSVWEALLNAVAEREAEALARATRELERVRDHLAAAETRQQEAVQAGEILQARLAEQAAALADTRDTLATRTAERDTARAHLDDRTGQARRLEQVLASLQAERLEERRQLEAALGQARAEARAAEQGAAAERTALLARADRLEQTLARAHGEARAERDALQSALEAQRAELATRERARDQERQALTAQFEAATAERQAAERRAAEHAARVAERDTALAALGARLAAAEAATVAERRQQAALHATLASLRTELDARQAAWEEARATLTARLADSERHRARTRARLALARLRGLRAPPSAPA